MSDRPASAAPGVEVVAHRGFAGRYPENTLAAFRAAARDADAVELDVVATADGDPVVFHDDRLGARERGGPTDASGVVWEAPTEVVTSAEVLDSGETVPTLAAVADAVPADVGLNVELKNPGTPAIRPDEALGGDDLVAARERWAPFVDRVLDDLADAPHGVRYSSFCEGALAAVRARSDAAVAPLVRDDLRAGLTVAERYDAVAIHPPWDLVAGTPFAGADAAPDSTPTVDVVTRAHDAGRTVAAWTVDTWYRADRLRAAGVDAIIADYPGLLDPLRGRREA
ncbi:MAG: glycerophosphodiester phosphodiesterase [Haloferacaceae archaeon]